MRRYVAACMVTDRQAHRMTSITLVPAPRVNYKIIHPSSYHFSALERYLTVPVHIVRRESVDPEL